MSTVDAPGPTPDPVPAGAGLAAAAGEVRCLIRGGGDLATGVAWRLTRAGFPVTVTELPAPLTVRRTVALSTAVDDGGVSVEGMIGRRVSSLDEAGEVTEAGEVAVLVAPSLPAGAAEVVVDARVAKRNLDTSIDDAPLVVALGPGFVAGVDCDAVVETLRGPRLGRVIWSGPAAADTGEPGSVGGRSTQRVLRATVDGDVAWLVAIGDRVVADQELGSVAGQPVVAPFDGLVRGLIRPGTNVAAGIKIGDIDPRGPSPGADPNHDHRLSHEISDKALAVGGGVVEAVLWWLTRPTGAGPHLGRRSR